MSRLKLFAIGIGFLLLAVCQYAFNLTVSVLEEKRKETENSCAEQFADMDRKLNDAKREHAKAGMDLNLFGETFDVYFLFK